MKTLSGVAVVVSMLPTIVACRHQQPSVADDGAVKVDTAVVELTAIDASPLYSGTVKASDETALSFPIGGTIKQIAVGVGDRVGRGSLIASIDNLSLSEAYDIALAGVATAQDAYDRLKLLHDANSLSDMKWVEAQNALAQAKSAAAIARRALADANIYAPFDGYVVAKPADVGMSVAPTAPVVVLATIDPAKVSISVPDNDIPLLQFNAQADVSLGSTGRHYRGKLVEKGVAANPITRSYDVGFAVDNPDGELLPGMICDVAIVADTVSRAIVVEPSAVMLDADNRCYVWLARNGRACRRAVDVGALTDGGVVIASGLAVGDTVIVGGQQKVSQGTKLKFSPNTNR